MHDLIIIGGGPGGIAAGVYAARKQLKTVLIAEEIGGQSTVSEGIENWIGTVKIPGADLAKSFKEHLNAYKGDIVEVREEERVTSIEKNDDFFTVHTNQNAAFETKAILVVSGASRRKLTIPGADTFENKGVVYCASCDGPLFSNQDVAVIGGGNAGLETALQLLAYAKSVTLINRSKELRGDPVTAEKVRQHPNLTLLTETVPLEVQGEKFVTGLTVENTVTKEQTTLPVSGVFVEIGVIPSTDYLKDVIELDEIGRVVTNPKNQTTSVEGIWAAGDCTDELYHQNNIAAGDAVKALEDIYMWLKTR